VTKNKSAKGWRKERECRKLLESKGWKIVCKSIRTMWGTYDFANLFDSVAVCPGQWLFVSNKHHHGGDTYQQHRQEIRTFKQLYGVVGMRFELWIWQPSRYTGRGKNREWVRAEWKVIEIE
jgi:Holliday junction resolvase